MRRVWVEMGNHCVSFHTSMSPSLRRVWVEITDIGAYVQPTNVTLLAEGVG